MLRVRRLVMDHRRLLAAVCAGLAVLTALTAIRDDDIGPTAVVARRDLSSGAVLTADDIRVVRLGADHRVEHALDAQEAVGQRLAGAVREGEVLTDRRLLKATAADRREAGTVVTTLALESEDALGPARVGDRVDVVAVSPGGDEMGQETAAQVVARGIQILGVRDGDDAAPVLVDVVARSDAALDLVTAGQRSRLSVLVSTPPDGRR